MYAFCNAIRSTLIDCRIYSKNLYNFFYKDDGESAFPTPSIEYEYVWIKKEVFLAVLGLDGLVFLFCICCAVGIIIYKRHL